MNVLVLVHRYPFPPTRGDSMRSWGEVEHLARRHHVWLACVDREQPSAEQLAPARAMCRDVAVVVRPGWAALAHGAVSLLWGRSLTEGYFHDQRLARIITRWGREVAFDTVLTFSPAMAPYALLVPARRRVLDMNDVESAKWRSYAQRSLPPASWLYALEAARLPRCERAWINAHDATLLVNGHERAKLPADLQARAAVVRTGLDLSRYADFADTLASEPVIGMVGSMSYPPNVRAVCWFGREVWPRIQAALPGARWLIVGSRPTRRVRRWGRQPGVSVTGFVADVRPFLAQTRVFACAAREQIGVQTKLIEALAAGRPAVVTPEAAAGLDFSDPPPFLVAGTPAEYAGHVVRLLRDEAQARALARRARATAEALYAASEQNARVESWLVGAAETVRAQATTAADGLRSDAAPQTALPASCP